jgi:hypothetical protein
MKGNGHRIEEPLDDVELDAGQRPVGMACS